MLESWFLGIAGSDPVVQALVAGVVIAGMNLLGALLVVVWRDPSQRSLDGALGFAAGVMLAASFTSLILPGIEFGGQNGLIEVIVGIALGVALLDRADRWVPHVHVLITGRERSDQTVSQADLGRCCCSSSPSPSTTCRRGWRSASGSGAGTSWKACR